MRWPWRKGHPDARALQARREAHQHLAQAAEQWHEVRDVAASLRRMRRENHFAAAIEKIMQQGNS